VTTEQNQQNVADSRRRVWIALAILAALLGMAAAWRWTPLADQFDTGKITGWAVSLRSNPAHPFIILATYLVGSIISVPITVLIFATALVFGPVMGTVYSFVGCLLGAIVTYVIGRFLGRDFIQKLRGPKWQAVERKINQTGVLAVATLGAIPIAPFTVINIIVGGFQVPIRDYLIGSLIGLAPGIIVTNLFAHQLQSAIRNPGVGSYLLLAVLIVISLLGTLWLRPKFSSTTDIGRPKANAPR
jgi:phospholipase D1/2